MSLKKRAKRRSVDNVVQVIDTMTGNMIGRLGNLSSTGLMLVANDEIKDHTLYQLQFYLPDPRGLPVAIEIGVVQHWCEQARTPGQHWAGFSFIDIAERDQTAIDEWVRLNQ